MKTISDGTQTASGLMVRPARRAGNRKNVAADTDAVGAVAEWEGRLERRSLACALAENVRAEMKGRKGQRAWMAAFLVVLSRTANVRLACYAAGINRQHAYKVRSSNEAFREEWDAALELAVDRLEEEAWSRAYEGVERYVISSGKLVLDASGKPVVERHYSDMLLERLLRAHRPQKYRDQPAQSEVHSVVKVYSGIDLDRV